MFKRIKGCFDNTAVNTGRQRELDIAKGFAIILMSFSHGIEILGWFFDPQRTDGFFWDGFDMLKYLKSILSHILILETKKKLF